MLMAPPRYGFRATLARDRPSRRLGETAVDLNLVSALVLALGWGSLDRIYRRSQNSRYLKAIRASGSDVHAPRCRPRRAQGLTPPRCPHPWGKRIHRAARSRGKRDGLGVAQRRRL